MSKPSGMNIGYRCSVTMIGITPEQSRAWRRRNLLRRQIVVFGTIAIVGALLVVLALPFASGLLSLPIGSSFSAEEVADPDLPPCVPEGAPPALEEIVANVLNGTTRGGLAQETAASLKEFGVSVGPVGNNPTGVYSGNVEIQAGRTGVANAYSLSRLFPGAVVVLTQRPSAQLDVILGEEFIGTITKDQWSAIDKKEPVSPLENCTPISEEEASSSDDS
ncbi:MAG: LytR C-terminal domain-containing protein [Actinomycetaceae bacterium]|nr:LytR C-terminal domain-containing protein [Actinomycetaceae bacterium]